jgi:hypothetical protein
MILLSHEGLSNAAIAETLGVTKATVVKWRQLFLAARLTGLRDELRPGRPRYHVHYTSTFASRLNQVERWFRRISQQAIRRGSFRSVKELVAKIDHVVHTYTPRHGLLHGLRRRIESGSIVVKRSLCSASILTGLLLMLLVGGAEALAQESETDLAKTPPQSRRRPDQHPVPEQHQFRDWSESPHAECVERAAGNSCQP